MVTQVKGTKGQRGKSPHPQEGRTRLFPEGEGPEKKTHSPKYGQRGRSGGGGGVNVQGFRWQYLSDYLTCISQISLLNLVTCLLFNLLNV